MNDKQSIVGVGLRGHRKGSVLMVSENSTECFQNFCTPF